MLDTPDIPKAPSNAAPGIKVSGGSLIFVSGQVAWDAHGTVVGKGDVRVQARQAFENLKKIFAQAGATLRDIVKLNIYLTDLAHRQAVREVRTEYLGGHNPPSTTVVVASLVDPDLLIEIDATALVEEPGSGVRRGGSDG
jgi:enamine deaminase RidA (YjgF/YER057c/UK114 family)